MAKLKENIEDEDLYELLGLELYCTESEVKKAYRKRALLYHPDKNPDNPDAIKQFHKLSRVLEILTDDSARKAYDRVLKARKETAIRHKQLDSKRQKLKDDLEAREWGFKYGNKKTPEQELRDEIERLRKEGSKQLEEEMAAMIKELHRDRDLNVPRATEPAEYRRIKLKWLSNKADLQNGGYNETNLSTFLSKYDDINVLVVSTKKCGSALVEFKTRRGAEMALELERGLAVNPLTLQWVNPWAKGRQLKPTLTELGPSSAAPLNRIPSSGELFKRGIERRSNISHSSKRFHTSKEPRSSFAKLSPQDVDTILRANEFTQDFPNGGSIKSYDSNQLASNAPMEDTRAEAKCLLTSGLLLGVFDGHAGAACAQVLAKRLFAYISAYLLPPAALDQYIASLSTETPLQLLEAYNDRVQFVDDVRDIYRASFKRYLDDIAKLDYGKAFEMRKALEESVVRLDNDLADEALNRVEDGTLNLKTLSVAMTGAVACVAHIDGPQLHIAHVGDCNAVLGVRTESNTWQANKLTQEHNTYNNSEYTRILSEHPHNESNTVLKMGRLLGQLAPLRALGDFRYKWSIATMRDVVQSQFGETALPPNYYTPPYLTARPEVIHHRLTPRDKFLVLATDGLWDIVSPLQVVRLVGEHMSGKVTLSPLKLPRRNMRLSDIHDSLVTRREGLRTKPRDRNAATHLIRSALGGTEYGIDHGKLSQLLSLPEDVVRVFRDDITITIVYFDSEYLRHCPA